MIQTDTPETQIAQEVQSRQGGQKMARHISSDSIVLALTACQTALVTLALVPPLLWVRLLPDSPSATLDGPFPAGLAPIIAALLYLLPVVIGYLCKSWQRALLYATIPACIGLGLFMIAATYKVGAFYLISNNQVTANASVLELFAALGGIGWLARTLYKPRWL